MTIQIVIASSNIHKVAEITSIMAPILPVDCVLAALDHSVAEPHETGATFRQNALIKSRYYASVTGLPALSDDSGLCVDALGGAPGIWSARYAPTDEARIARLLSELSTAGADSPDARSARFVCVAAVAWPDGRTVVAEGVLEGVIAPAPIGENGFGYDPVFFLPERRATVAQLCAEDKNAISHRASSLRELAREIRRLLAPNDLQPPKSHTN